MILAWIWAFGWVGVYLRLYIFDEIDDLDDLDDFEMN